MKKFFPLILSFVFLVSFIINAQVKVKNSSQKVTNKTNVVSAEKKENNQTASKEKVFNKVCPVSGEDLENNDNTYVYNGKTYGLCCKKCLAKFQKDPAKYASRLNVDGTKFTKK